MMPLSMAKAGEDVSVKKIGGGEQTRKFLETLGFVPGAHLSVVSKNGDGVIVTVKASRVALGKEMAMRILI